MECFCTPQEFSETAWDYIIVGGGTAGLVVASRLSEDSNVKVGVIEAGGPVFDDPRVTVPGRMGQTIGTEHDWAFETIPQPGLNGRTLPWPRGKMVGGTSAMNFMVWNRAAREDYDGWESLGNPGWGWAGLKYYFMKSESLKRPSGANAEKFKFLVTDGDHGIAGPVQTSVGAHLSETHNYWHDTLQKLNIATNEAHFGGSNVGAWTSVVAADPKTATRSYSASAYLLPSSHRSNLKVLSGAQVEKILWQQGTTSADKVACGIAFNAGGVTLTASCTQEVILSGGSVGSPHLLELSGIGSPEILKKAGIQVQVANPNVGENLQEHPMTMAVYELSPHISTPDDYADPEFERKAFQQYQESRTGLYTSVPSSFAYVPVSTFVPEASKLAEKAREYATSHRKSSRDYLMNQLLQHQFLPKANVGSVEYIMDHGNFSPVFKGEKGKKYATLMQVLQYPYSRGSIHINTAAPSSKPLIDPKYYEGEGEIDYEVMVEAQKFGDKICRTSPMNSIVVKRVYPPEEPEVDWNSWMVENTITDWHPVGTCSMLPRKSGGVVDSNLKVYGTTNVRVVDASIFPMQVSAHIQATIYAVAEKGADCIKQSWDSPLRARL
ncbi:putative choline dehydrogenase [Exophiala viscosa]|uniref:putative choline dehydrogenase n=1 Tax=Exophiala viscosa TaxID=2486360 RepID=UPI0021901A87|nr:putative choline dehydrogenase [Exophiala viscosa]